eukprot:2485696-Rhodomonas_salina.1
MEEGYAFWPGSYANRYCFKCACASTSGDKSTRKKKRKGELTGAILNLKSSDIKRIKDPNDPLFSMFFNFHNDGTITLKQDLLRPASAGLTRGGEYPGYNDLHPNQHQTDPVKELHPKQHQPGPGMGQERKPATIVWATASMGPNDYKWVHAPEPATIVQGTIQAGPKDYEWMGQERVPATIGPKGAVVV